MQARPYQLGKLLSETFFLDIPVTSSRKGLSYLWGEDLAKDQVEISDQLYVTRFPSAH